MTIDEEIKQTNWESLRQKAMVNTMFTSRVLEAANTTLLKEHHLTLPQYNILRILRGRKGDPSTVKLLTERMLDKSSNASRLVDTLLEKGLVQRVSCPSDRRAVEVTITATGLEVLSGIDPKLSARDRTDPSFTEADAENLSDLLDRFRAVVRSGSSH